MYSEREIIRDLRETLKTVLDVPVMVVPEHAIHRERTGYRPDMMVLAEPYKFVVEYKSAGTTDQVALAGYQLASAHSWLQEGQIPLIVVPYMSAGGRKYAQERGISWIDLSGNARVIAPGLRVVIEGKPNRFIRRGRPRDLFAPRSVRVTRALLLDPLRKYTQAELAKETGLTPGTVSRVVAGLADANLIERSTERGEAIRVPAPSLLLEAWRDAADFSKQTIHRYVVATRSSEDLARRVANVLQQDQVDPIATGLVAAWLYAPYADFRLATFYVRELPSPDVLTALGARSEPRGANVWLVVPKDEGVRMGMTHLQGVPCVSAVQVYIDLKGHAERATDAAEALRWACLRWTSGLEESGAEDAHENGLDSAET